MSEVQTVNKKKCPNSFQILKKSN